MSLDNEVEALRDEVRRLNWSIRITLLLVNLAFASKALFTILSSSKFQQTYDEMLAGAPIPPLTAFFVNNAGLLAVCIIGLFVLAAVALLAYRKSIFSLPVSLGTALSMIIISEVAHKAYLLPIMGIIQNLTGG